MFRILKVVLLVLLYVLLAHRLYFLYYGQSNILTTFTFFTSAFILLDGIYRLIFKLKWQKSNFRLSFWIGLLCVLLVEVSLRYYFKLNVTRSEHTFWGKYYSPYRNVLFENKVRLKGLQNADVGLRLYAPNSEQTFSNSEFNFVHQYNSFGLRNKDINQQQLDTSKVILTLGDSFTEGVGTAQDATWVALTNDKLNAAKLNTIATNAGYAGSDPFFEYYKLEKILLNQLKPDVVIIALNETDITDILIRGGDERFVNEQVVRYNAPPWWEYLYAFSYITRYFVHNILQKDWFFFTKKEFEKQKQLVLNRIYDCMMDFNNLAQQHDFKLIVLYLPMQHEVDLDWKTFDETAHQLENKNIVTLNLMTAFQSIEKEKAGSYYWEKDRHFNSKGNELVAEKLTEFIISKQNLLLE
jgi:lysophospholipase L1-like esterase